MECFFNINSEHLNSNGTLFGGELMKWMDDIAHKSASNYANCKTATSKVEDLVFLKPVFVGDKLKVTSKLLNARACTMEFQIDSFIITKEGENINASSHFHMVAINDNGKPIRIRK